MSDYLMMAQMFSIGSMCANTGGTRLFCAIAAWTYFVAYFVQ